MMKRKVGTTTKVNSRHTREVQSAPAGDRRQLTELTRLLLTFGSTMSTKHISTTPPKPQTKRMTHSGNDFRCAHIDAIRHRVRPQITPHIHRPLPHDRPASSSDRSSANFLQSPTNHQHLLEIKKITRTCVTPVQKNRHWFVRYKSLPSTGRTTRSRGDLAYSVRFAPFRFGEVGGTAALGHGGARIGAWA